MPFKLELPTDEELKLLAKEVLGKFSRQHRVKVELSNEEFDRLAESLKGFTLFEAERVVSRSIFDDLTLNRQDLDRIVEIKKDLLESEALLEYIPPQDGMDQIGGLKSLKAWRIGKRFSLFT